MVPARMGLGLRDRLSFLATERAAEKSCQSCLLVGAPESRLQKLGHSRGYSASGLSG